VLLEMYGRSAVAEEGARQLRSTSTELASVVAQSEWMSVCSTVFVDDIIAHHCCGV